MSNTPDRNKEIALAYLNSFGQGPEACADKITDDFTYHLPPTATEFLGVPAELKGVDGLRQIMKFDEGIYQEGTNPNSKLHFLVSEDDWVILQTEVSATLIDGEPYHSYYSFSIRIEGDKVAEVWEHVDTLYCWLTSWHFLKEYPKVEKI